MSDPWALLCFQNWPSHLASPHVRLPRIHHNAQGTCLFTILLSSTHPLLFPHLDSTTFRGWLTLVYRFLVLKYHEMLLVREMTPFYKQWSPILYSLGNLLCFNRTLFKLSTWFCPLLPEQTYKCFIFSFLCFNYVEHPCQYITKSLLGIKSILITWNAYSLIRCCPCTLCSSQFLNIWRFVLPVLS